MSARPGERLDVQMPPLIRRMQEHDIAGYNACLDAVARERLYLAQTEAPPVQHSRDWILPQLARSAPFFVAVVDETIAGWCDITPLTRPGFTHRGELGMGVLAPYRGRGIGRQLLEAAIAQARSLGLERIELQVFAGNRPAISLYQRSGFEMEGRLRQGRKLDGASDDILCMALHLTHTA